MTKNSEKILEIIEQTACHPTAEEIYRLLASGKAKMVMATVYNNLNALCRAGKVRRLVLEGQPDRFDRMLRHDHLICSCCGKISDLYLPDLTAQIEEQTGIMIQSYDLKISYRCEECRRKAG